MGFLCAHGELAERLIAPDLGSGAGYVVEAETGPQVRILYSPLLLPVDDVS